jgi:hypothetical protein
LAVSSLSLVAWSGCNCSGKVTSSDGGLPDGGRLPDGGWPDSGSGSFDAGVSAVLQHHKNPSRDGLYVDPAMTLTVVPNLQVDIAFVATTSGQTFAQPLFMENGPQGKDTLFVVTEQDDVYALNAMTGAQLWKTNLGVPAPASEFCGGSIDPLGITGTPVIDAQARIMYVAAMTNAGAGGTTPRHVIDALGIDDGGVLFRVDVSSAVPGFDSTIQNERGALALVNGVLYVPYGGLDGDCGNYHGWVVAVPTTNHAAVTAWATAAPSGSGIWAPSGIASDGTNLFVSTGNTNSPFPTVWAGANSNAVIRLTPGPTFDGGAANYFTMTGPGGRDWYYNDLNDNDLGSSGVVLVDAPGAQPSTLAFANGKTQTTYLMNRDNLGGPGLGYLPNLKTQAQAFGALFAYNTPSKTYVGGNFTISGASCSVAGADFHVLTVSHTNPPALAFAWCGVSGGSGSPIASTTDGQSNAIVWTYGSAGDETLRAYNGTNGALLFTSSATLPSSQHWLSPIIAKGRLYVAADGTVTAFKLP